ncbi:MAG TPA: MarR family winged helix-turn-helix transcriptional regulator [Candidatus Dormibacteraeota bacterium]|jgi:DNA-binding MarR family transcriptional regulator|nr:MarR family winged helix-turn-helix transcriptional regulator [Candidatus Dormibacteraeota bacterium]
MSTDGVRLARDALADIALGAQLRGAFAEAQAVMAQTLAGFGLTEQRYHLLLVVAAGGPDGTGQGALASELHCPHSRISLLVRELSDASMVEAVRDGADRRHVRVRLRPDGEAILDRAISVQREALHSLIANLEVGEVTRLAELVARTYLGLELSVSVKTPAGKPARREGTARARFAGAEEGAKRTLPLPAAEDAARLRAANRASRAR